MFDKDSRYDKARGFTGDAAFPGHRPREIGPAPGVVEHIVAEGDRLDHLARHYYDDDRLWWRIADANPAFLFAPEMLTGTVGASMVGQTILIPKAKE